MNVKKINPGLSFTAGKVQIYSDFDGTYCPAKHSSMHEEGNNKFMPDYCENMDSFLKSTKGDVHLHVTTGRTFGEFASVLWLLKIRNFRLPLPETFIAKNGSDEYVKTSSDKDFYEKGIFPYQYEKTNKNKEEKFKKNNNWDGEKLKNYIRKKAKEYSVRLVEADSENSVRDYGDLSLFASGKLDANDWKRLPQDKSGNITVHKQPIADYSLGSRNDGNLKVHLVFSPDYGFCPERNWIYDNFMNDIKNYLKENEVKFHINWETPDKHNHYRNSCNITPEVNGGELTKLYDTKEALKKAIKNNDMVIVAGDGSNDFDMLNPLEYIDSKDWKKYASKSEFKDFYNGNMYRKLLDLDGVYNGDNSEYISKLREELIQNGLLNKIDNLPVYGIVVNKDNSKLSLLIDTFAKNGKIIPVDKGKLDEGIKLAINNHAKRNKNFNNGMSEKFKSYIFTENNNSLAGGVR